VVIPVSENDINKLKSEQKVSVKVDAVDNKIYEGIVTRIDKIGTEVQDVVHYKAYVEIIDPDDNLKPGMSVDVNIITKELKDVLSVPSSAIKPYKGGKAVRVPGKKKDDIEFVSVQIGIRGDKDTQIIQGLSEGQIIIISLSSEETKKSGLLGF